MSEQITYRVVLADNQGSFAGDALASAVTGSRWWNSVNKFDGTNDLVFIDVPADEAEYFESVMNDDDNVIEYEVR